MGRKTSRGVIKYAVFKEFNKIMKMLLYHTSKRKIKKTRSFYELCSVVLSFLLNLVLCLLAEDFIGMFIHFSDSKVYILAIIVSVLLTVYGFLHANHIYIKHYAIPLEDRKNPVKVAFLSDIHTGTFVNKIDLVVFGHTHKGQFFLRIHLQNGLMEGRDFTDILKRTRHTVLFLRVLDIFKCR